MAILALLGGFLGIAAMVPLRRLLIVRSADELPYPEGTACAEVLRATTAKTGSGGRWIFIGLAVGALIKLGLGAAVLLPSELAAHLPVLPKAEKKDPYSVRVPDICCETISALFSPQHRRLIHEQIGTD